MEQALTNITAASPSELQLRITNRLFHTAENTHISPELSQVLVLGTKFIPSHYIPLQAALSSIAFSTDQYLRALRIDTTSSVEQWEKDDLYPHFPRLYISNPLYDPPPHPEQQYEYSIPILKRTLKQQTTTHHNSASHRTDNLSKPQRTAIKLLRAQRNSPNHLLALPADKNLGICILRHSWIIQQQQIHLKSVTADNKRIYATTKMSPQIALLRTLERVHSQCSLAMSDLGLPSYFLNNMKKFVTRVGHVFMDRKGDRLPKEQIDNNLANCHFKNSFMRFLPKVHKDTSPWPSRALTAAHLSPAQYPARMTVPFLDFIINGGWTNNYCTDPLNCRTVLTSTTQLIQQLESTQFHPDCLILTVDVVSMYPSMDTDLIIQELTYLTGTLPKGGEAILILCKLILSCKFILTGDTVNMLLRGLAMGFANSGHVANATLQRPELIVIQKFLSSGSFPQGSMYRRYQDDCLMIWNNSNIQAALDFITALSEAWNLQVTIEAHPPYDNVNFLDITIYKGERFQSTGILDIKSFSKPSNVFQYIPFTSLHRKGAFTGMIKAELQRHARNNSMRSDYLDARISFYLNLRARGYPELFLINAFKAVDYSHRNTLLSVPPRVHINPFDPPSKDDNGTNDIADDQFFAFKLQFNSVTSNLKIQHILKSLPGLPPTTVCWTKSPALSSILR